MWILGIDTAFVQVQNNDVPSPQDYDGDEHSSASSEKWQQLFKGEINCIVPTTASSFQEQQINLPASGTPPVLHNNL